MRKVLKKLGLVHTDLLLQAEERLRLKALHEEVQEVRAKILLKQNSIQILKMIAVSDHYWMEVLEKAQNEKRARKKVAQSMFSSLRLKTLKHNELVTGSYLSFLKTLTKTLIEVLEIPQQENTIPLSKIFMTFFTQCKSLQVSFHNNNQFVKSTKDRKVLGLLHKIQNRMTMFDTRFKTQSVQINLLKLWDKKHIDSKMKVLLKVLSFKMIKNLCFNQKNQLSSQSSIKSFTQMMGRKSYKKTFKSKRFFKERKILKSKKKTQI